MTDEKLQKFEDAVCEQFRDIFQHYEPKIRLLHGLVIKNRRLEKGAAWAADVPGRRPISVRSAKGNMFYLTVTKDSYRVEYNAADDILCLVASEAMIMDIEFEPTVDFLKTVDKLIFNIGESDRLVVPDGKR